MTRITVNSTFFLLPVTWLFVFLAVTGKHCGVALVYVAPCSGIYCSESFCHNQENMSLDSVSRNVYFVDIK